MIKYLMQWLGLEKPAAKVGLRPHRTVELPLAYSAAYSRVLEAIELTLGANVSIDDRAGRLIEAGFGLVNNERIRCSFEILAPERTAVRIEAFFPAGATVPEHSRAVDALAVALGSKESN
jgi:hypothetical protein